MQLEIEKKTLITENEYNLVLKNNIIDNTITQTNYYFETNESFYKNNNSALRVRVIDNFYQLTLKVAHNQVNKEYNFDININTFNSMIKGITPTQIIDIINNNDTIINNATIITKRTTILYKEHVIEVDKSTFNNMIDYEIEVESNTPLRAQMTLQNFIDDNCITYKKSKPKIARFFDYNS